MSFWGSLFGTNNVINSGINLIDEAFYTDDEKAEQKRLLLKAYEPYKLAQRMLVALFIPVFLGLVIVDFGLSFFVDVSAQVSMIDDYLSLPVTLIVGFYFGGGAIEGAIDKIKGKK
jgi:type III secretory pathway component EscT